MKPDNSEQRKELQSEADKIARELGPITEKRGATAHREFMNKLRKWTVLKRLIDRLS